jgi:hypothetical protein
MERQPRWRYRGADVGATLPQLVEQRKTNDGLVMTPSRGTQVCGHADETPSWAHSDKPSYLIAIRGSFSARRPLPMTALHEGVEASIDQFSVLTLVVERESGKVVDSGCSNQYPDLSSVGPVITDRQASS